MIRSIQISLATALIASALVGCAAPAGNARLEGTIVVDRAHDVHHGAPIRLAFRASDPEVSCRSDLCGAWQPVERCTVGPDEDVTKLRVVLGHDLHSFSACTGDLNPEHTLEVVAFIDLAGDGELSEAEPRSVHRVSRSSAKAEGLELRIGQL